MIFRSHCGKSRSFGEILRKRYDALLGTEGSDLIDRMQSAASRMQALIEDLLTFSHVSNQHHAFQELDLNSVIQEVLTDLETTIKAKSARVSISGLLPQPGDKMPNAPVVPKPAKQRPEICKSQCTHADNYYGGGNYRRAVRYTGTRQRRYPPLSGTNHYR